MKNELTNGNLRNYFSKRLKQLQPDLQQWDEKTTAELFSELVREFCRYDVTAKEWRVYNGRVWKLDTGSMNVSRLAKVFSDCYLEYGSGIADEKTKAAFRAWALRYGQLRNRETLIKDARDCYFVSAADLDANPDLLNLANGTLDLRTFAFKKHDPADLLTKCAGVSFMPGARSERWERFIDEVMQGDAAKAAYLKRIVGYALTADTFLECCWILYGASTRNGKSTLIETIAAMLGDYALSMPPETLAQRQTRDTRQASGDIARLNGCRFLSCSEPPKRMLLDNALLKTLLGRDTITARNLYEREVSFVPVFKLFFNCNSLPLITDDTVFSSQRIRVLTFDRHFSPEEQDRNLKTELRSPENLSGILNWCLAGLKEFRRIGEAPPSSVTEATAQYRKSSDKIGLFLDECLEYTGGNSAAGAVYGRYAVWCSENGYGTDSKRSFFDELRAKGLLAESATVQRRTVRNAIVGYELQ